MYNEAARIAATVHTLADAADTLGDLEVLFVDDGSDDATAALAEDALIVRPDLRGRVVRLAQNRGKGGAIAAGVTHAGGRAVAFADADLSTPPSAIAACFEAIESGAADVVVTSRHAPESTITGAAPATRKLSTTVFRRLLGWRLGLDRYTDTQCGLKGFTREAARSLFTDLTVQRFAFDVEVLLRAEVAGLRVIEMPIEWHHVDDSTVRPIRDGARMAVDVLRLRGRVRRWQAQADSGLPVLALLERRHWWYVSHRETASDAIANGLPPSRRHLAIDTAAGTGTVVDRFAELGFDHRLGLGTSAGTLRFAGGPAAHPALLSVASGRAIPLADSMADAVTAIDTIAVADDDVAIVVELARVTRPGGIVVITGPGMRSMWSDYDAALGHRRRYDRSDLEALLGSAGLEVVRVSHFHAWLTPLTLLLQRTPLRRVLLQKPEQATFVDARLNRVLRAFVAAETLLLRWIDLPFGQAVIAVGRRPDV